MPLLNKQRVPLSAAIPFETDHNHEEAWYIQMTNEVFTNYELYLEKLNLYQQPIWECESTGRNNLTYEQALQSESSEYMKAAYKFSSTTRKVILNRVQFQTLPLDDIVEDIYMYLSYNYAVGEIIQCKLNSYEYYARIVDIIQPDLHVPRQSDGRLRFPDAFLLPESHRIATRIPEPKIRIQLVDSNGRPLEEYIREIEKSEVYREAYVLNRHNIKMFIQECFSRSTTPNSQWTLKPSIAAAYGINVTKKRRLPDIILDDTREEKKVRKDDPYSTHQRVKFKDEKRKKQQIKYPLEDLDLPIYRKDPHSDWNIVDMSSEHYDASVPSIPFPKAGRPDRPTPHQESSIPAELYGAFLSAWAFMTVFAEPLKIAAFHLDAFEEALLRTTHQPKATVLVEYNASLLNIIISERDNDTTNELINGDIMDDYVAELEEQEESSDSEHEDKKKKGSKLKASIIEPSCASLPRVERGWRDQEGLKISQKWDHKELRANYHRRGWETSLIGCLNDVATPDLLTNVDELLQHLIPKFNSTAADREKQYPTLSVKQKLDILNFLISAVNESTPIKNYMDHCQEQLSELRKQKIELNKEVKALRIQFDKKDRQDKIHEMSEDDESEKHMSDDSDNASASDSDSHLSRQEKIKLQKEKKKEKEKLRKQQAAEQREATKVKNTEQRMKAKEKQMLEDTEKDLKKREDHLERSIRRYMTLRIRPIGKDRFYNRYFFLDNVGEGDNCGSGRLFVHSPSDEDILLLMERDHLTDLPKVDWGYGGGRWFVKRLMEEHGFREESCWLEARMEELQADEIKENPGWWRYYIQPEEINQLIEWLNPKGVRETKLKNELTKLSPYIQESMLKKVNSSGHNHQDDDNT